MTSIKYLAFLLCGFIVSLRCELHDDSKISCPHGWELIHRSCYKFNETEINFHGADEECKANHGGQLASFESTLERNSIADHLRTKKTTKKWWAGLKKEKNDKGDWKWMSHEDVGPNVKWDKNSSKKRNGPVLGGVEMKDGELHLFATKYSTQTKYPFICEYHDITPRPTTNATTPATDVAQEASTKHVSNVKPDKTGFKTMGSVSSSQTEEATILSQTSPVMIASVNNNQASTASSKKLVTGNVGEISTQAKLKDTSTFSKGLLFPKTATTETPDAVVLNSPSVTNINEATTEATNNAIVDQTTIPSKLTVGTETSESSNAEKIGKATTETTETVSSTAEEIEVIRTMVPMKEIQKGTTSEKVKKTSATTPTTNPTTKSTTPKKEPATIIPTSTSTTLKKEPTTTLSTTASTTSTTTTTPSTTITTTSTNPSTTTATTTTTSTTTTTTTTTERRTPKPRRKPVVVVDWDLEFRPYEGCYIPGSGMSLKETVLKAREFYGSSNQQCPRVTVGRNTWPATQKGKTESVQCHNKNGYATFSCGGEKIACWQVQPDLTGCASKRLQNLLQRVTPRVPPKPSGTGEPKPGVTTEAPKVIPPTVEESIEISSALANFTKTDDVTMEDILLTSDLITTLTAAPAKKVEDGEDPEKTKEPVIVKPKNLTQVKEIVENVVQTGSNLLANDKTAMWNEMADEDKVRSASTLLVAIETATVAMADEIEEVAVITKADENLEVELHVVDVEELEKEQTVALVYDSDLSDNSFSIPMETLKQASKGGKLAKAVFMTHYSMADLLGGEKLKPKSKSPQREHNKSTGNEIDKEGDGDSATSHEDEEDDEETTGPKIASYILSASLGNGMESIKLTKPITFTMKLTQEIEPGYIPLCSFYNMTGSRNGFWSQKGCIVKSSSKFHTTCECDHMTNFAILLDIQRLEVAEVHQSVLRLVTIIGCGISLVALAASWITFQTFTSLQGERNSIHKNLALSLFMAELIFLCGIDQVGNQALCATIAGLLHYFFLAAFTWMFIEGIHILFMLVQVFDSSSSRLPLYYCAGYGVPLIIVGVSCLYNYQGYGTDDYCWLSQDKYFLWAFAGPVALILLVNAAFLAYAMAAVCRHAEYVLNTKDKGSQGVRAWIQGALALEVLLGLTWTLGYFQINGASMPIAYAFTICNSLQGLFIFIFHCLMNKKTQKEYKRVLDAKVKRSFSSLTASSSLSRRHGPTHDTSSNSTAHAHTNGNSNSCNTQNTKVSV